MSNKLLNSLQFPELDGTYEIPHLVTSTTLSNIKHQYTGDNYDVSGLAVEITNYAGGNITVVSTTGLDCLTIGNKNYYSKPNETITISEAELPKTTSFIADAINGDEFTVTYNRYVTEVDSSLDTTYQSTNPVTNSVIAERFSMCAEGSNSNYQIYSDGWKRIAINTRSQGGTVNVSIGTNNSNSRMFHNVTFGYEGYVDHPSSNSSTSSAIHGMPYIYQISNNVFGEDPAQNDGSRFFRITKARICYPIAVDEVTDDEVASGYKNPVNVYLDIYVSGDFSNLSNGVQLVTNITGKSYNHDTEAISKETIPEVDENGYVLGKDDVKCKYYEFEFHSDYGFNSKKKAFLKEVEANDFYTVKHNVELGGGAYVELDDVVDISSIIYGETADSAYGHTSGLIVENKANIIPGHQVVSRTTNGLTIKKLYNGIVQVNGTATSTAYHHLYQWAVGSSSVYKFDVPLILRKGVTYYYSGCTLKVAASLDASAAVIGRAYDSNNYLPTTLSYTPETDEYLTHVFWAAKSGTEYDNMYYYPQITTDPDLIVGDISHNSSYYSDWETYVVKHNGVSYLDYLTQFVLPEKMYSPAPILIMPDGYMNDCQTIDFKNNSIDDISSDYEYTGTYYNELFLPILKENILNGDLIYSFVYDNESNGESLGSLSKRQNSNITVVADVKSNLSTKIAELETALNAALARIATLEGDEGEITFTISGGSYTTTANMTWGEFVNDFNSEGVTDTCGCGNDYYRFVIDGTNIHYTGVCEECTGEVEYISYDGVAVTTSDIIVNGRAYYISTLDEDTTTITFSVGEPDGSADSFTVSDGTTWEEFANSEDNLRMCEDCGEDKPVITISGGYVYCNCVIHTAEGVRRCADCEGSGNVYYFDDDGAETLVKATDLIEEKEYYCHREESEEPEPNPEITFTIDGNTFTTYEGATWNEIANTQESCEDCGTDYNQFKIEGDEVYFSVMGCPECAGGTEWKKICGYCDGNITCEPVYNNDSISNREYVLCSCPEDDGNGNDNIAEDNITFYLNLGDEETIKCIADYEGMTWGEWIENGEAPEGLHWEGDMLWYDTYNDDSGITPNDYITDGKTYYFTAN